MGYSGQSVAAEAAASQGSPARPGESSGTEAHLAETPADSQREEPL